MGQCHYRGTGSCHDSGVGGVDDHGGGGAGITGRCGIQCHDGLGLHACCGGGAIGDGRVGLIDCSGGRALDRHCLSALGTAGLGELGFIGAGRLCDYGLGLAHGHCGSLLDGLGGGAHGDLGLGEFYCFGLGGEAHRRLRLYCYLRGITLRGEGSDGAWLECQIDRSLDINPWHGELDCFIGVGIDGDTGIAEPA